MSDHSLTIDAICYLWKDFSEGECTFGFVWLDAMHIDILCIVLISWWADQGIVGVDNLIVVYGDDSNGAGAVFGVGGGFKIDSGESHEVNINDSMGQILS